MLGGSLPADFPSTQPSLPEHFEGAIFIRSECTEELGIAMQCEPSEKRCKLVQVAENDLNYSEQIEKDSDDSMNTSDFLLVRHVQFSDKPPIEFLTFPDSEYDRSSYRRKRYHEFSS